MQGQTYPMNETDDNQRVEILSLHLKHLLKKEDSALIWLTAMLPILKEIVDQSHKKEALINKIIEKLNKEE